MGDSPSVSAGDYGASIGTTGFDYTLTPKNSPPIPNNGVFQAGTGIRLVEIIDGLSNTLLVGEKHVPIGWEKAYPWDCGLWDGHNIPCSTRAAGPLFPLAIDLYDMGWKFGGRHPGNVQFVFCDGSVRSLAKSINPVTLGLLAQRNDGQVIPDY